MGEDALSLSAPVIGSATAEPTFECVVSGLRSISFSVEDSVPIAAIPIAAIQSDEKRER